MCRLLLVTIACVAWPRGAASQHPGVTWLVFVDDLHLAFRDTGVIRYLLRSIASQLIRDEDTIVLRCSGPSFDAMEIVGKRATLVAATAALAGNALLPAAIRQSPSVADEEQYRVSLALSAATEMLDAASSFPERRAAMVYVSNGYPLAPDDSRLTAFVNAAQRFRVPVFAMNGRGLQRPSARHVQDDAVHAAMLDSLRAMSEPTGGIAVLDEPEFDDALQRGVIDLWVR